MFCEFERIVMDKVELGGMIQGGYLLEHRTCRYRAKTKEVLV